ncbi:MAG TPA: hypothetical protein VG293_03540 [Solirubrobacteraceae bacterium]|jgi:hypothetical protein|nr:hypothetical protein [Solirubrobacteraceae bacterium]
MRRLLAAIVTSVLLPTAVAWAAAAPASAASRLPRAVAKVSIAISFPLKTVSGYHKPVHRTLTRASTVAEIVSATDALPVAKLRGMCPMIMRIGPELTVVFRNASGTQVATAEVAVTQGSKGDSGSSACFPIRFTSSGQTSDLLGNGWVRMMGRLTRTAIS